MENTARCYGCMRTIEKEEKVCPHCGFDGNQYATKFYQLKHGTMLNNRYVIGKMLGEGGFGITYIGWDSNLEVPVAIKEYYPNGLVNRDTTSGNKTVFTMDGSKRDVFELGLTKVINEARRMAQFRNMNGIVSVMDFFKENGTAYIVMEYVDGITFNEFLKKSGKVPPGQVLKMFRPLIESLSQIHESGLIHRDISPDNVMINNAGAVRLLDFGAARDYGEDEKSLSIMLRRGYAPEEQYRSRGMQGPWTDVYALCATMYKMMTGITPIESLDRMEEDLLKKPSELGLLIDKKMENVLLKGMAIFRKERIQNMKELYKEFYGTEVQHTSVQDMISEVAQAKNEGTEVFFEEEISVLNSNNSVGATNVVNGSDETQLVQNVEEGTLLLSENNKDVMDKTVSINQQTFGYNIPPVVNPSKKKRKFWKVIVAVLVVCLFGGGFVYVRIADDDKQSSGNVYESEQNNVKKSETNTKDENQEQIDIVIAEIEKLLAKEDYEGALKEVQEALETYSESKDLKEKEEECKNAIDKQVKEEAVENADTFVQQGDYLAAAEVIKKAISKIYSEDTELDKKLKEYETIHVENIIKQVDEYISARDYTNAEAMLEESLKVFPENADLISKQESVEESIIKAENACKYIGSDITAYNNGSYYTEYNGTSSFSLGGVTYQNGFTIGTYEGGGSANYNLGGNYKYIAGVAGNVDGVNCTVNYNVLGDDKLIGTIEVKGACLPTEFEFDVTGVKQLTIIATGNNNHAEGVGFGNVVLYNDKIDKPNVYNWNNMPDEAYIGVDISAYEGGSYYEEYKGMSSFKLGGVEYYKGFTIGTYDSGGNANYNLGGKYKHLSGIAGNVDGVNCDVTYNVMGDGKLLGSIVVKGASLPKEFGFDVTGVKQLTISAIGNNNCANGVGFANVVLK